MKKVKKSLDISGDLAQQIDSFLKRTPGLTFSLIVNQAVSQWLKSPKMDFSLKQQDVVSDQEIEKLIEKDGLLMEDLAGDPPSNIAINPKRSRTG